MSSRVSPSSLSLALVALLAWQSACIDPEPERFCHPSSAGPCCIGELHCDSFDAPTLGAWQEVVDAAQCGAGTEACLRLAAAEDAPGSALEIERGAIADRYLAAELSGEHEEIYFQVSVRLTETSSSAAAPFALVPLLELGPQSPATPWGIRLALLTDESPAPSVYGVLLSAADTSRAARSIGAAWTPAPNAWHQLKAHVKRATSATAADGALSLWIDGALVAEDTAVRIPAGVGRVRLGIVHESAGNAAWVSRRQQFDDWGISRRDEW